MDLRLEEMTVIMLGLCDEVDASEAITGLDHMTVARVTRETCDGMEVVDRLVAVPVWGWG